jgi:acyl-coenzyme A thioesterase PaaI-like protein
MGSDARIVVRGRTVARLKSWRTVGDALVAQANGNYSIFTPRAR